MTKVWHPNVYEVSEYTEIIDPLHTLLPPALPVSPLVRAVRRVRACPSVPSPLASLFRSSVRPAFTPLVPPLAAYNDRPVLSALFIFHPLPP